MMPPLVTTLMIVGALDVLVLSIVVVLFRYLKSQASAEGTGAGIGKWKAGGALAGFVIVMSLQLYAIQYFSPKGQEARPSYSAVYSFYDRIQRKDYRGAWAFIAPEWQASTWKGDVGFFVNGFENTNSVDSVAIRFYKENSSYSDDYVVYYRDRTLAPTLDGLTHLDRWKLRDVPRLNNELTSLRKLITDKNVAASTLDDMELGDLMVANRGDLLRWRIEKVSSASVVDSLFPSSKEVARLVGKLITVELRGNKWLVTHRENIPYSEE